MHIRNGKIDLGYAKHRLSITPKERIDEVLPMRRTGINMKKRVALEDGRLSAREIYRQQPAGSDESLLEIRKKISIQT